MNVKDCLNRKAPELAYLWPQGGSMHESRMNEYRTAMKRIYEEKGWPEPQTRNLVLWSADLCQRLEEQ